MSAFGGKADILAPPIRLSGAAVHFSYFAVD